ncbi:MAG TPA: T9SS type A sorting domain-containing protein [Bacteroidia bacterium]|jgi:hypothetical protein|nr:T9SS type A sorting domain-containing protein [Bacteroidia bacterium]
MSSFAKAQTDTAWVTTYGGIQNDWCQQIKPTYDGGYITIGTTNSFGCGNTSFYVIKTDSLCKKQWSKTYGGAVNQAGYSVATTYDHGYAFVGYTDSYDSGNYQVYLVRTDSLGNVKWQKTYGGKTWSFGYSIAQTYDSGFVVCGLTYSYPAINGDMYVVRADKNGDTVWTRTIGGAGYDLGNSVYVHSSNLYAIVGATTSFGAGDTDMYIVELDSSGIVFKDTTYGCTHNDVAYSIWGLKNGGFLIYGSTDSTKALNVSDQVLYETDSTLKLNVPYPQIYPSPKTAIGKDAEQALDGSIVTVGTSNSSGGGGFDMDMQQVQYGGGWFLGGATEGGAKDEYGNSLAIGRNGNVVFAGATASFGQGLFDVYLVRVKNDSIRTGYDTVGHYYRDSSLCASLGLAAVPYNHTDVMIYPNPMVTEANIIIQSSIAENYSCKLYDVFGRCVMENIPINSLYHGQSVGNIKRNGLNSGVYFYEIFSAKGRVASGKLSVE